MQGVTRGGHFALYGLLDAAWDSLPLFPDEVERLEEKIRAGGEKWDASALESLCKGTGNKHLWNEGKDLQAIGEALHTLGYHVF